MVLRIKLQVFFKTSTLKKAVYGRDKKPRRPKTQNIRNGFILKHKKEVKNRKIRDVATLFETEGEKEERKKVYS